jgi:hypothetical protein
MGGGESSEDRLARRKQSPAYKRAMSNLHLQFIAEFMAEKPLVNPTANSEIWNFDPSGLGEETHFSLWWWLPSITLILIIIIITIVVHRHTPAPHSRPTSTV